MGTVGLAPGMAGSVAPDWAVPAATWLRAGGRPVLTRMLVVLEPARWELLVPGLSLPGFACKHQAWPVVLHGGAQPSALVSRWWGTGARAGRPSRL